MKNGIELKRLPARAFVFAVLAALLGGASVGLVMGYDYRKTTHLCKPCPKNCRGYTVVDATHVVDCEGDTVYYQWKQAIQYRAK